MLTFPDLKPPALQTIILGAEESSENTKSKITWKTESEKGKEQRQAHDKVEYERNNERKKKVQALDIPHVKTLPGAKPPERNLSRYA